MHKVEYASLMFPPIPAPPNDKEKDDGGQDICNSVENKEDHFEEKPEELPFDRQLVTLNTKLYEFTDSELDLYCRSSGSSNHSDGSDEVFSEGEYVCRAVVMCSVYRIPVLSPVVFFIRHTIQKCSTLIHVALNSLAVFLNQVHPQQASWTSR